MYECWKLTVPILEQLKTAKPNMSVLEEYRRREEEFLRRAKDLDETTAKRDDEKTKYENLRKQRLDEFMTGFNFISMKLKEMYQVRACRGCLRSELTFVSDDHSWRQRGA
jgi:structural maintenance of chromosome 4